jgi:hypothetical protein
LTRSINPIIDDLISFGSASDEQQNVVFNGLEAFRNLLRGLSFNNVVLVM